MQKFLHTFYGFFGPGFLSKFILVALVFVAIGAIYQFGVRVGEFLFYVLN